MPKSYTLISLGCPKNEVDAECMSSAMQASGYVFTEELWAADVLIINTCSFIADARTESVEQLLYLADIKAEQARKGRQIKLVLTGCLAQRYGPEIQAEVPEVDLVLGTGDYYRLVEDLKAADSGPLPFRKTPPGSLLHLEVPHKPQPDRSFAWLKVAEGCNNRCSFCAIPMLRGKMQSRPIEAVLAEARSFSALGFEEQIIIAQDTTRYGQDLYGAPALTRLLEALLAADLAPWLRMMYVYADVFSDRLVSLMAEDPRVLPYVDMPIQHVNDSLLRAMSRRDTKAGLRRLIEKLRREIPGVILRSTVIVGFPGETEAMFEELLDFIQAHPFDRLGAFTYSRETGTRAASLPDQVPAALAKERYDRLMAVQSAITKQRQLARIGSKTEVLIEGIGEEGIFYTGRSYAEAPEVDPIIYVASQSPSLKIGRRYLCEIIDHDGLDLLAKNLEDHPR